MATRADAAPHAAGNEPGHVALPALLVVDSRPELAMQFTGRWRQARAAGFEVLSQGAARETAALARRLWRFRLLCAELAPAFSGRAAGSVTLVLVSDSGEFDRWRQRREIRGETRGASDADVVCSFVDDERIVLVADLARTERLVDEGVGLRHDVGAALTGNALRAGNYEPVDLAACLEREYVRAMLRRRGAGGPRWLEEGMAALFATAELDGSTLRFGRLPRARLMEMKRIPRAPYPRTTGRVEEIDEVALYFHDRGLLPLERFFAADSAALEETRTAAAGTVRGVAIDPEAFAMQSLALVHHALYADAGKHQAGFLRFVESLHRAPANEATFRESLGTGYRRWLIAVRAHLDHGKYRAVVRRDVVLPAAPRFELEPAAPGRAVAVWAESLKVQRRWSEARAALEVALRGDAANAQLWTALGVVERASGEADAAVRAFERATALPAAPAAPYLGLARSRLDRALAKEPERALRSEEFVAILRGLKAARDRDATPPRAWYETWATTWLHAPVTPRAEHLAVLEEGVLRFPDDAPLIATTLTLQRRLGRNASAFQLARLGEQVAADEPSRRRFAELVEATRPARR